MYGGDLVAVTWVTKKDGRSTSRNVMERHNFSTGRSYFKIQNESHDILYSVLHIASDSQIKFPKSGVTMAGS